MDLVRNWIDSVQVSKGSKTWLLEVYTVWKRRTDFVRLFPECRKVLGIYYLNYNLILDMFPPHTRRLACNVAQFNLMLTRKTHVVATKNLKMQANGTN